MKHFHLIIIFFYTLGFFKDISAQPFFFERFNGVSVNVNGTNLTDAWAGAWNNPQFSSIDIDRDGLEDIYVYDRSSHKSIALIWIDSISDYRYESFYDSLFPSIHDFGLMYDFDGDGDKDLFSHVPGGIKVHKNLAVENGQTEFVLIEDKVMFNSGGTPINIYVSSVDIPAFSDVDGDGDMDILTFDILGGFLDYYENTSFDFYGHNDSLSFVKSSDCWGKFVEPGLSNTLILAYGNCRSAAPDPKSQNLGLRHAGSSILAFDPDKDGDKDLLLGDVSFNNLVFAKNGRSTIDSIIDQDTLYPSYDTPVDVPIFPAAFELDVDHDGNKDLIAAPNVNSTMNSWANTHFYKNTSSGVAVYSLEDTAILQKGMIDVGERSIPVFFDYNSDGLKDIIVANYGRFENNDYKASLSLFENTGSMLAPSFNLITNDWLNIKSMDLTCIVPSFGDIDGDGDADMLVGDADGKLHFFENTAAPGQAGNWILMLPNYQGIDVGQFASPCLYDINKDGLLDLVVGRKVGLLSYFQNIGTASAPNFFLLTDSMGKIDVKMPAYNTGYSTPHIAYLDSSDMPKLMVGAESGLVTIYEIDTSDFALAFQKLDTLMQFDGRYSYLSTTDLDGDQKLDMLLGNQRGGIALYESSDSMPIIVDLVEGLNKSISVDIYPNPSSDMFFLRADQYIESIIIYNSLGQEINRWKVNSREFDISSASWPRGLYFISVANKDGSKLTKFMKD